MSPSVVYLGYKIDSTGIHPLPDKVQAVLDAPNPKNIHKLKSYSTDHKQLNIHSRALPRAHGILLVSVEHYSWAQAEYSTRTQPTYVRAYVSTM